MENIIKYLELIPTHVGHTMQPPSDNRTHPESAAPPQPACGRSFAPVDVVQYSGI